MRKRVVSAVLALLLAVSLGVPAFALEDGEEDLFAASLDMARALEQADGIVSGSYVELCGTLGSGEEAADVDVEWDYVESACRDGYRLAMAQYESYDPVESYRATAVVADGGEVYFLQSSEVDEDDLSVTRYEAAPEDAFSDMSGLSAWFAALGGRKADAAVRVEDETLAYETTGAAVRDLLVMCCPRMLDGFEDLDWDSAPAQVQVELDEEPYEACVTITSPQLGEAILRSLDGEAAVTDVAFTVELDIVGLEEDADDYAEYRIAAQELKEAAEDGSVQIEDREGESPVCGTAAEFLRAVCASGR